MAKFAFSGTSSGTSTKDAAPSQDAGSRWMSKKQSSGAWTIDSRKKRVLGSKSNSPPLKRARKTNISGINGMSLRTPHEIVEAESDDSSSESEDSESEDEKGTVERILESCNGLASHGKSVFYLTVSRDGLIVPISSSHDEALDK